MLCASLGCKYVCVLNKRMYDSVAGLLSRWVDLLISMFLSHQPPARLIWRTWRIWTIRDTLRCAPRWEWCDRTRTARTCEVSVINNNNITAFSHGALNPHLLSVPGFPSHTFGPKIYVFEISIHLDSTHLVMFHKQVSGGARADN